MHNLTASLVKTHQVLSKGMQLGAYAELKKMEAKKLANTEKQLEENFTEEGLLVYQSRMIKGFKLLNLWRTI